MIQPPSSPAPSSAPPALPPIPSIDSQQLLLGGNTVEINHAGQRYQLRVTRENKLILTK